MPRIELVASAESVSVGESAPSQWADLERRIHVEYGMEPCKLYRSVLEEWEEELVGLLSEFRELFFYDAVRDQVELNKEQLLRCDRDIAEGDVS